jgi:hypothetical protein
MAYGSIKTFSVVIASGASTSSGFALGGRPWARIGVQVGTMSTAAAIGIQNSVDGGTTYFNVFHPTVQSATVATPQLYIASGVGTNGGYCSLPPGTNLQNARFIATAVVSGGVSFNVLCSD